MKVYKARRLGYDKKASLSLSVNAIVVLVLGITMLGLGLAFTKGMFGKLKGKLEIPPPNIPATADEPIVLPTDEVKLEKTSLIVPINVYNKVGAEKVTVVGTSTQGDCGTDISMNATPQKVPDDQFRTFQVVVTKDSASALRQTCLFTLLARDADVSGDTGIFASKQISLVVE